VGGLQGWLQRTEALLWTMALLLLFVVTPYLEIQR
jgi:hypothetical protein